MIPINDIDSFLYFGYFQDYKNDNYSLNYSNINPQLFRELSERELIEQGYGLFLEAIESNFKNNQIHVVPVSGGLDSRAILASLLEFTDSSNIYTYTFGTPGTLDYDIGNKIAEHVKTKHFKIPLTNYNYNMDELIDVSKKINHQTVLFHHPPMNELESRFSNSIIWSGFLGDVITDARFVKHGDSTSLVEKYVAVEQYQKELLMVKDKTLKSIMKNITIKNNEKLSKYEFLNYENRQLKFIAPHVLMNGFNYKTPFIYQPVFDFYNSIDNYYRVDQYLYKKILIEKFPGLFSLPSKNNLGLPISASETRVKLRNISYKIKRKFRYKNINTNYLDFEHSIREKKDLKNIIKENIYDLKRRNIIDWMDIEDIYIKHIDKKGNYSKALMILASLEIHLKSSATHI